MNLSELAAHLDVSVTTVSRVLAGTAEKYRISEATCKRVREAADKFNAAPNPLGTNLRKGQTGMIGLLVPDITNPFFAELSREIEGELRRQGKATLLFDSDEDLSQEQSLLRDMMSRRLDGFIIASVGVDSPELKQAVEQQRNPVVLVDRLIPGMDVRSVSLDNHDAGQQAVSYLLQKGHHSIGVLRGDTQTLSDTRRFEGICAALGAEGLSINDQHVAGNGFSLEAGMQGAETILSAPVRPTALITRNGQGLLALLRVLRERGLSIPKDLSVIAFDEQPWSPFIDPPITTVSQPIGEIARNAVKLLLNIEEDPETVLKANIVERDSVINS